MSDAPFTFTPKWWRNRDTLVAALEEYGSADAAVRAAAETEFAVTRRTVAESTKTFGLNMKRGVGYISARPRQVTEIDPIVEEVNDLLSPKRAKGKKISIAEIADELDISPKRVRLALEKLRLRGIRIPEEDINEAVAIERDVPVKAKTFKSPFSGQLVRFGIISDTHLSSNEQALDELEHAYDVFVEEGITQVYHPGDWTCGSGIFAGQKSEIFNHTFDSQVQYLVDNYPRRDGIKTSGITGNHDIEGDFGRMGANPVLAFANKRDDIEFLGDYAAWINIHTEDAPCWLYLLHGKGGMSYAYSYKAQKLVDGFAEGRRPDIMAVGHWHVTGNFAPRGTQVIFPGCFEWRSKFMERLGLQPAVGYWIIEAHLGDDGSIARWKPEWFPMREHPRGIVIPDMGR